MLFHRIRLLARRFGLEVLRADRFTIDEYRLENFLSLAGITAVLDVGANTGQFAEELFASRYAGQVVSFEPLPDAHAKLAQAAARRPRWSVPPALALSDRDGTATFNVSANSVSSSLLPMDKLHVDAAPESRMVQQIEVTTRRLDSLWPKLELAGERVFLKIDTQGSEDQVLDGASGVLGQIVGIKLELSLANLYDGQQLLPALFRRIEALGYVCCDLVPGFRDSRTARLLQCDGIFFREGVI